MLFRSERLKGQTEVENRSVAELADQANDAAMRFYDGFRDGQSHARALHTITFTFATIELVKNQSLFEIVYARPVIGHTNDKLTITRFCGNMNRRLAGRVFTGVFQQLTQNISDALQINPDKRRAVGQVYFHRVSGQRKF